MPAEDAKDVNTFMAELAADSDYQARIAAQDLEHERLVLRNRADAAPLARALAELGFTVEFPEDLLAQGVEYRAAVPVLIRWLPMIDNPDVKCSVVRALTVPWAGPGAAKALVEELRRALGSPGGGSAMVVFDIANALEVVADEVIVDDLLELSRDRRIDVDARAFLVQALGRVPQERVVDALLDLVRQDEDPLVLTGALNALGRLRDRRAREVVETLTGHGDRRVKKEAQRVLKRLH